ncbi:MAG: 5'-nucleotidase C-terminal domain-containing protein [Deltaproteobacteria bacterium]|nr:5'-nucleotidase C-terminal domain-containing protein [Deltaproteobacteria bacterium]
MHVFRRGLIVSLSFVAFSCGDEDPSRDGGVIVDGSRPDAMPTGDGAIPDVSFVRPDASADGGVSDSGPRAQSILILHTNDEHSQHVGIGPNIDDVAEMADPNGGGQRWVDINTARGTGTIKGGLKRRAALLARLKRDSTADGTLIVGAGDLSMGSFFHLANAFRGIDYSIATALRYDVLTLGNHELDFGLDVLAKMITTGGLGPDPEIEQPLDIPLVVSNIRFSGSTGDDVVAALYGSMKPIRRTYVKTVGGVKVGFVGYMGLEASLVSPLKRPLRFSLATGTAACASDADCPGSACLPPASAPTSSSGRCAVNLDETDFATHIGALVADVASAVAEVRAQDVDLVVAVSHAGVNEQELALLSAMGEPLDRAVRSEDLIVAAGVDQALSASGVAGIDVIVGGHSHTALPAPLVVPNRASGINTFVVQAGSYGGAVGRLRLSRPDRASIWTLEGSESGLLPIDDTVDTTDLNVLTELLIDTAINGVVNGFESSPAGQHGDGLLFPGEQCDQAANGALELPNEGLCLGLVPGATGGALACFPNSQLDLSACVLPACNHSGTVDPDEHCDQTDLGTSSTCAAHGYTGGTLSCSNACTYDFSGCTPFFPSFAEIGVNFGQPGAPVLDDRTQNGDLVFGHVLGHTSFDVKLAGASRESNLLNLVADGERAALNMLARLDDPVRVVVAANGLVRDHILEGTTGNLSLADLFRVLPLGVSPREKTPGFNLVELYLTPAELKAGLEVGVAEGLLSDSFWLGVSGVRVEYDPSLPAFDPTNPLATGRITKLTLTATTAAPWQDQELDGAPIFDLARSAGPFPEPDRLIHVATSIYVALFMEAKGLCPRNAAGAQLPQCKSCTTVAECPSAGSVCANPTGGTLAGHCIDPVVPGVVLRAARQRDTPAELKEVLALIAYVRSFPKGEVPNAYAGAVPRRVCCVGSECGNGAESRSCD